MNPPNTERDPQDVFLELVTGVAEGRHAHLHHLYAEDARVEHPFAPGVGAAPLRGREQVRAHFTRMAAGVRPPRLRVTDVVLHRTGDPEVVVAEFAYAGDSAATGEPFRVPCVFVMRIRDGRIVASRDYVDHIRSAAAFGRTDQILAAIDPARREPPAGG